MQPLKLKLTEMDKKLEQIVKQVYRQPWKCREKML